METKDVWFDLCVGNIETDDRGLQKYKPSFTRMSRVTADVKDIANYREILHKLLDKAIDEISKNQTMAASDTNSRP